MNSFKDLEIYKESKKLAIKSHHFSLQLPKYEMYETGSQLRKATKSIVFNIAEGFGRRKYKDEFIRFLIFSQASCDEVYAQYDLLKEIYKDLNEIEKLKEEYDILGKRINKFISYVSFNWNK